MILLGVMLQQCMKKEKPENKGNRGKSTANQRSLLLRGRGQTEAQNQGSVSWEVKQGPLWRSCSMKAYRLL